MIFNPFLLLSGAKRIEDLFQLEKNRGSILERQAAALQGLKARLTKLEKHVKAREEILVADAKGAAAAVASVAASQHVSDVSRRLGAMEERLSASGAAKSSPPDTAC